MPLKDGTYGDWVWALSRGDTNLTAKFEEGCEAVRQALRKGGTPWADGLIREFDEWKKKVTEGTNLVEIERRVR
jgi:hypothetical protein